MSRYTAACLHFLFSAMVGILLLALCWFVWYPAPMLMAIGGINIFLLIVSIDVVLGPLLTLVVFKTGKRSLTFDLAVIVALQIGAMAYGVSTLLEARPVYVAALGKNFQVVQASEVTDANLSKAKITMPWWGPTWVGTKAPEDRFDIDAVNDVAIVGAGRGHFPQLHVPYETVAKDVLAKSQSIATLISDNAGNADEIRAWLKRHNHNESTARFQPIQIVAGEFVVVLDGASGAIVGIAPFKP
jgi:hypothetical protein